MQVTQEMPTPVAQGAVSLGEAAYHARLGNALHKWVNDKTASGSLQVLTDSTLYYDIPENKQVFITMVTFDMQTHSDDVHIEMVSCSGTVGGGSATAISGHCHMFTGAAAGGQASKERPFYPPIRVRYSDGARSVTMRIEANDSSAILSCGWMGWVEDEL